VHRKLRGKGGQSAAERLSEPLRPGRLRHSARPALRPVCGSLSALSLSGGCSMRTGQAESWRTGAESAARGASRGATICFCEALLRRPAPSSTRGGERRKKSRAVRPRERCDMYERCSTRPTFSQSWEKVDQCPPLRLAPHLPLAGGGETTHAADYTGLSPASISARRGSRNGGSARLSPSESSGSSTAKPGPSEAISKRMPFGSRKYRLLK
jgi:hypothetical protein